MRKRMLKVAACAPATCGFVAAEFVKATEKMIRGHETDPGRIREHVDRMLDHHIRLLRKTARRKPDVAVIPEDCLRLAMLIGRHRRRPFCGEAVRAAYARYCERIGEVCRRHRMYVVGGTMTCRQGRFYNTAVMQDPRGRVIATYDKTHLPRNGEAQSLTPGDDLPVFDTPIGKVGFLICWDIIFPETYATLALKGAEIVFQPTFGHWEEWSDMTARSRCHDWSVPMAVSMWGGCACIIDQEGRIAAHTGRIPGSVAVATLKVGARRRFLYLKDARRQKPVERRPEIYAT